MAHIQPGMGVKEIIDNRKRGAWGHEYNVKAGDSADQTPALENVLNNVVLPSSGRDYAPYYLPPGKVKLATTWVIHRARGCIIRGAGRTANKTGPRNHNGNTNMSGTDLYWAGAAGGTVVEVNETSFAKLCDFAVYLDEFDGANRAAIGIHFKQDVSTGHGRNSVRDVSVVAAQKGGTGFHFGVVLLSENVDTFYCERSEFRNLSTGCFWKHEQALEWTFIAPNFQNVDTFFHFENGGNFYCYGFQAQRDLTGNVVILKVDNSSDTTGSYHLHGGYLDRQAINTYVTLFETTSSCKNTRMSATGVNIRKIFQGSATPFDGSSRAFIEAHGGCSYTLDNCALSDQPIVRWRTTADITRRGQVTVRNTQVHNARKFGSELVTCLEGGYAGDVHFDNVMRKTIDPEPSNPAETHTVTVNRFPIFGRSNSHFDIDNFDSTDTPSLIPWNMSWLGGGATSSPSWSGQLAAYYPFNEAIGAISAVDRVNSTALDLTIDADMQVPWPPMPYLDQWCDFSKSDSTHGRDTGVAINPASENLTVFGFIELQTRTAGRCAFSVNVSGENDFEIGRISGSVGTMNIGRSSFNPFMSTFRTHTAMFIVVTISASLDRWDVYLNGCLAKSQTSAGYSGTTAGTVYVGGRNSSSTSVWPGRMSRVGIIKAYLTAQQATILSCQAATCGERRHRYPLNFGA